MCKCVSNISSFLFERCWRGSWTRVDGFDWFVCWNHIKVTSDDFSETRHTSELSLSVLLNIRRLFGVAPPPRWDALTSRDAALELRSPVEETVRLRSGFPRGSMTALMTERHERRRCLSAAHRRINIKKILNWLKEEEHSDLLTFQLFLDSPQFFENWCNFLQDEQVDKRKTKAFN